MLHLGDAKRTVRPHAFLEMHTEQDLLLMRRVTLAADLWRGADVLLVRL